MPHQEKPAPGDMEEGLAAWLDVIDARLSEASIPLPNRPFQASHIFIDEALVAVDSQEIDGSRFDEYLKTPWFKKLYRAVNDWYEDKYGKALRVAESYIIGAVLISGLPFEVRVPVTLSRVEEPGKTAWLTFPSEVQEDEDPPSWIETPPNLERLDDEANAALDADLSELATHLRALRLDLSCSKQPEPGSEALANKVIPHLESAANQLVRGRAGDLGLAAWNSHQAPESLLKLLRRQGDGQHRHSHDLRDLLSDLGSAVSLDSSLVASLPSGKRIVEIRAGEGQRLRLNDTYSLYRRSIFLAHQAAIELQKGSRIHNASFLIQKVPWID